MPATTPRPAHEIAITLTLCAMYYPDIDPGEDLRVGWGLGHGGDAFGPQLLDVDTVIGIAAGVHLLLSTGRRA